MNKITAIALSALIAGCVIVLPLEALAGGSFKIGGKVEDSVGKNYNLSQNYSQEFEGWQIETETNYYYTENYGNEVTNRGDGEYEVIVTINPKHYAIGAIGFNYNRFREYGEFRPHHGVGWGWKIFKTDSIKVSNEFTINSMGTEDYAETVWRNSFWVRYKHPVSKVTFTNKYLYENGDYHELNKNEFEVSYPLSDKVTFSLTDLYISDEAEQEYSITYFSLGYKF